MTERKRKKAVGYTRVSTQRQAKKGESLLTQEASIKRHAELKDYELTEIYSDEGISGGTVAGRPALRRLLANLKGIDCLIVYRLSRLGRNSRELLNNVNSLQEAGLEIVFTEDNFDLSTPQGRALLTILSSVAQLEREIISETTVENKIARCRRDIPATGRIPWGRIYDAANNQWSLDEEKKELFEHITDEYINGGSLLKICEQIPTRFHMSYTNYLRVLERAAGDTWAVKFKREEHPININVPPLIPSEKIKKAIQMRRFNTTFNRHDVKNKYLLSGFVRCDVCERVLIGQTQKYPKSGNTYRYYRHKQNPGVACNALKSIPGNSIEQAVLEAIWENVIDEQGFEASLTEMLPDKNDRLELVNKIDKTELALKSIDQGLSKLADAVIEGILTKETIKAKESELLKEKALLNSALSKKKNKLSRMADPAMVAEEARQVRLILLDQFGSAQHFIKMGFDQRRRLFHTMFDGKDEEGKKRGVYIKRLGRCKFEYHILTTAFEGIRVMFKRDFNYYNEDDPEMPEYQIRDKLKASVELKGKVRTKVNHSDIGSGDSNIERLVEINGIRRKRKFRDNK